MEKLLLFFFVIVLPRTKIICDACIDIAASTAHMQILVFTQSQVIQSIEDYLYKEKKRLEVVQRFLKDTEREHGKALADVSQYMANPINSFRLVRRLKVDMEKLEAYMPARVTVYRKSKSAYYPDPSEMSEAAHGLVRLQMIYKLQVSDLANGILKGTFSKSGKLFKEKVSPMTSSDCFFLGQVSFKNLGVFVLESPHIDLKRKLRWMLEAHKKFQLENCTICPVDEVAIMDHISKRYQELGDLKNSMLWIQKRILLKPNDPKNEQFAILLTEMQKILITARFPENNPVLNKTLENRNNQSVNPSARKPSLKSVCYNNSGIPNEIAKSLSCHFAHGPHPFLRLARLKAEKMYINPDITLYYDVLNEEKIKILKLVKGMSGRAGVSGEHQKVNYRVAKSSNFNNTAENRWLFNHIIQITNMNMGSDDVIDVLNYGIGGHYSSHHDFFSNLRDDYIKLGDRPASILFYLSDVEQGGATAFEKLGVLLYPVKGAALVWHNLYPSGDGNFDTLHEACPVLRGSKWIAVKWLREVHQTSCPIWRTKDGMMTQEKYLQYNIRQPFRDARFTNIVS